jgi:hypothetical protein
MYRGRIMQGQELTLGLRTLNGSNVPTAPDAAPTFEIYGESSGTRVLTQKFIPPLDRYGTAVPATVWQYNQFMDERLSAGRYTIVYRWTISSFYGTALDSFEVVAGGNPKGTAISSYYYRRPNADFVVQQTDAGRIIKGRNPGV